MNKALKTIFIIVAVIIIIYLIWYLSSIVLYIVISGLVSLLGRPLVELLTKVKIKKFHISASAGAAITLLLFWIILAALFGLFIPQVVHQFRELSVIIEDPIRIINGLNEPLLRIEKFLARINPNAMDNFSIKDFLVAKLTSLIEVQEITGFFQSFAGMLGDIFIAVFSISFISFFFLKDKFLLINILEYIIPKRFVDNMRNIVESAHRLLGRYFIGIILEVFLVMVLTTLGAFIIGLNFDTALVIGLVSGTLNVIPYIGPWIGAIFGLLIITITNLHYDFYSTTLPLLGFLLIVVVIVHLIDNIVFQPLIYSSSVNAHPLEIFLVILIAGHLIGILGMVIAIPSYTVLRVIAKEFFNKNPFINKLTSKI